MPNVTVRHAAERTTFSSTPQSPIGNLCYIANRGDSFFILRSYLLAASLRIEISQTTSAIGHIGVIRAEGQTSGT